jgi:cytochrome oxidase Cu insertion factor (SCO1/SenC/PrrC family)
VRPAARTLALVATLVAALNGCTAGGPASAGTSPAPTDTASAIASISPGPATPIPSLPAWQTETLTDVQTGQLVQLSSYRGRILLLEGMATWCPPCLEQQDQGVVALKQLTGTDVAYVSIDVDPRETSDVLRAYADRHHFGWPFLVASPAFLRELSDQFGISVLNPPSTPVIVVGRDGVGHLTEVGIKSAARLVQLAKAVGA